MMVSKMAKASWCCFIPNKMAAFCGDTGQNGVTVIPWNLHGSSGHRMQPGLYLVKAMVGTADGASAAASCKLVIVGK